MSKGIESLNIENIVFSKTKVQTGNKFLYVYENKKPVVISMPKSRIPFGIVADTLSKNKQFILDISFENHLDNLEYFKKLDNFICEKVHKEFFSEKTIDEVRQMYNSNVKESRNNNFAPTFRTKIITNDAGDVKCDFYKHEQVDGKYPKVNLEENGGNDYITSIVNKNTMVEVIVECIGLWIRESAFGLSFKAKQIMYYPQVVADDYGFIDSDSDTSNSELEFCS